MLPSGCAANKRSFAFTNLSPMESLTHFKAYVVNLVENSLRVLANCYKYPHSCLKRNKYVQYFFHFEVSKYFKDKNIISCVSPSGYIALYIEV